MLSLRLVEIITVITINKLTSKGKDGSFSCQYGLSQCNRAGVDSAQELVIFQTGPHLPLICSIELAVEIEVAEYIGGCINGSIGVEFIEIPTI